MTMDTGIPIPSQAVLTVADSGGAGSAPVQGRRDPELSRRRRLNTNFPKRRVTENNQHHPKRSPAAPTEPARGEAGYGSSTPPAGPVSPMVSRRSSR